jgi:hypothetical protein
MLGQHERDPNQEPGLFVICKRIRHSRRLTSGSPDALAWRTGWKDVMRMTGMSGSSGWRTLRAGAATLAAAAVLAAGSSAVASASSQAPDWAKETPADHPSPRIATSMAYDAANGTVVLFGGYTSRGSDVAGTWTWDGTTWTRQTPAASPPRPVRRHDGLRLGHRDHSAMSTESAREHNTLPNTIRACLAQDPRVPRGMP